MDFEFLPPGEETRIKQGAEIFMVFVRLTDPPRYLAVDHDVALAVRVDDHWDIYQAWRTKQTTNSPAGSWKIRGLAEGSIFEKFLGNPQRFAVLNVGMRQSIDWYEKHPIVSEEESKQFRAAVGLAFLAALCIEMLIYLMAMIVGAVGGNTPIGLNVVRIGNLLFFGFLLFTGISLKTPKQKGNFCGGILGACVGFVIPIVILGWRFF